MMLGNFQLLQGAHYVVFTLLWITLVRMQSTTSSWFISHLEVEQELDGDLAGIGSRFWALLESRSPALRTKFASGTELRLAKYSDRYVKSPLASAILLRVVEALRERGPSWSDSTSFHLSTLEAERPAWNQDRLQDDWGEARTHRTVLASLFAHLRGQVRVLSRPSEVPHHRVLELLWVDGTSTRIQLDQGFGFLFGAGPFDFSLEPEDQVQEIRQVGSSVKNRGITLINVVEQVP